MDGILYFFMWERWGLNSFKVDREEVAKGRYEEGEDRGVRDGEKV